MQISYQHIQNDPMANRECVCSCAHTPNRIIKGVHQDVRSRFRESLMLLEVGGRLFNLRF